MGPSFDGHMVLSDMSATHCPTYRVISEMFGRTILHRNRFRVRAFRPLEEFVVTCICRRLRHSACRSRALPDIFYGDTVTPNERNSGSVWNTSSDVGAEAMASPAAWWEAELPAPKRRTALPQAKLKLPSAHETWNIVKHMVTPCYTNHISQRKVTSSS